jgi:hypothetical protein
VPQLFINHKKLNPSYAQRMEHASEIEVIDMRLLFRCIVLYALQKIKVWLVQPCQHMLALHTMHTKWWLMRVQCNFQNEVTAIGIMSVHYGIRMMMPNERRAFNERCPCFLTITPIDFRIVTCSTAYQNRQLRMKRLLKIFARQTKW